MRSGRFYARALGITALAITTITGCAGLMASTAALEGSWALREIRNTQGVIKVDAPSAPFTLTLDKDQRAYGTLACNRWHGHSEIKDGQLKLLAPGVTRMRCIIESAELKHLEKRFLPTLQRSNRYIVTENQIVTESQLQLSIDNGDTWIFERQQP